MNSYEIQDGRESRRATMIDRHVGHRIREQRMMLGLSQQQLARIIGISNYQQNKYERGLNRISVGRLCDIAQALAVEPAWFFEDVTEQSAAEDLPRHQRMRLELLRNFTLITDEKQQEAISNMARMLAGL